MGAFTKLFSRLRITSDPNVSTETCAVITADTTNTNLVIAPNGTGGLIASIPDGTTTGGNARGDNAVDLQTRRFNANQVASGAYSTVLGGSENKATGALSVAGGWLNTASGERSVVPGGYQNTASGIQSAVGGGITNTAGGESSVVAGGQGSTASGLLSSILGGFSNVASSNYSTVLGGQSNTASTSTHATVVGGSGNVTSGQYSISGGLNNVASGNQTVALGNGNIVQNLSQAYGFGNNSGGNSCTAIGQQNTVTSNNSIGIGIQNIVSGEQAFALGSLNNISVSYGIALGAGNSITGASGYSFGRNNSVSSSYGVSIGFRAASYLYGQIAFANDGFLDQAGRSQNSTLIARKSDTLTSAGTTVLSLDGTGVTNLIIPAPNNRMWNVSVKTIAVVTAITGTATGVTVGDTYMQNNSILFKRRISVGSTLVSVGTAEVFSDTSMSTSLMTYTKGASEELALTFTAPTFSGGGSVTIRVVAKVELVEVAY